MCIRDRYEGDTLVDKKLIIAGKEQKAEWQAGNKGEKNDNKNLPGRHPACLLSLIHI